MIYEQQSENKDFIPKNQPMGFSPIGLITIVVVVAVLVVVVVVVVELATLE